MASGAGGQPQGGGLGGNVNSRTRAALATAALPPATVSALQATVERMLVHGAWRRVGEGGESV